MRLRRRSLRLAAAGETANPMFRRMMSDSVVDSGAGRGAAGDAVLHPQQQQAPPNPDPLSSLDLSATIQSAAAIAAKVRGGRRRAAVAQARTQKQ